MERPVVFASGIPKKNKDGSDMLENVERKSGCLDPKFIEKQNPQCVITARGFYGGNKESEDEIPKGFPPHAYWKVLDHESVCVDEPYNATFKAPRAPTIPAEDALKLPIKYNFAENFD